MVVLDTDIIIDHLRQPEAKETGLMKVSKGVSKEGLSVSLITVQELYEGQSTKDKQAEEYLLATLAPLKILPYSYEVAQLAGEIARDLKEPIELADAAIAATVIINGAKLMTKNKKHFQNIPNLEFFSLDE